MPTAVRKTEKAADKEAQKKRYFEAVGRRKSSVARVRIFESTEKTAGVVVNGKNFSEYFPTDRLRSDSVRPLVLSGLSEKISATVSVRGGGITGQAQAVRLGCARALSKMDAQLRPALKAAKLLRRDPRVVERKKPGLKKARRAPQWSKR